MTPEEIEASHKELPEVQRKEFEKNETIKGLLTGTAEKSTVIKIGTIDVTIRASLPRKLRRDLIAYQRIVMAAQDTVTLEDLDGIETALYPILTEVVISPPELKDPAVWQYLDEKDGLATTAFTLIMAKINEQGEDIKKFRNK
ncbi:hypothetical protein CCP3SC15_420016 [Gammaproteobacteria bacterium]